MPCTCKPTRTLSARRSISENVVASAHPGSSEQLTLHSSPAPSAPQMPDLSILLQLLALKLQAPRHQNWVNYFGNYGKLYCQLICILAFHAFHLMVLQYISCQKNSIFHKNRAELSAKERFQILSNSNPSRDLSATRLVKSLAPRP